MWSFDIWRPLFPMTPQFHLLKQKKKLQSGDWECGSLVPRLLQRREPLEKPGNEARNVVTTHVVTTHVATCG